MRGGALEPTALGQLARRWAEAWSGDPDAFAAVCTADVGYEDPLVVEPLAGTGALADHAHRLRVAFPDLRLELTGAPLADLAHVCLPWRMRGTHRAEVAGVPASNRPLDLVGIHYAELADDRLRRVRGFFDLYAAAGQLGLVPPRGSRGEAVALMLRGFGLRMGR